MVFVLDRIKRFSTTSAILTLTATLGTAAVVYLGLRNGSLERITTLAYLCGLLGLAVVYMRTEPLGPALFLAAITPFDGLFFRVFGHAGNLITLLPVFVFASRLQREELAPIFLGTWVQRLTLVFVGLLSVAYVPSLFDLQWSSIFVYGQKVVLFLLVALLAHSFRDEEATRRVSRTLVISTTIFVMLSVAEFYYGVQILPEVTVWGEGGVVSSLESEGLQWTRLHDYRLRGLGNSQNVNRLAMFLILPSFLGYGWWLLKTRTGGLAWQPILCVLVMGFGLFGTLSRSGFLGFGAGLVLMAILLLRILPIRVISVSLLVAGALMASWYAVVELQLVELLEWRLSYEELVSASSRVTRWNLGLELFRSSPLTGVGAGRFSTMAINVLQGESPEAHSALINLLAEHGLVGTLPFLLLTLQVLRVLLFAPVRWSLNAKLWRVAYLAAFVGLLTVNIFNTYQFERSFWMVIAFAAALEGARNRPSPERHQSETELTSGGASS